MTSLFEKDITVNEDEILKGKFLFIKYLVFVVCTLQDEHSFLINLNEIENLTLIGINYKDKKRMQNPF